MPPVAGGYISLFKFVPVLLLFFAWVHYGNWVGEDSSSLKVRPVMWNGRLYIPDKNMRVTAKIEMAPDGQLKVSGCLIGKSMCKSQLWTPVEGALPAPE